MTLSIIVPVYNAEPYLAALLDSILLQDFGDYELLLVDDGSSDGSAGICREYAARDPRIRLFHQENRGVSTARNLGLDHVSPDTRYIYFCDADDTLCPGALSLLVDAMADESHDLAIAGFNWYNTDGTVKFEMNPAPIETLTPEETLVELIAPQKVGIYNGLWNKLFKATIIKKHGLKFDETIFYNEDCLFLAEYISRIKNNASYTTTAIYNYILRRSGALSSAMGGYSPKYLTHFQSITKIKEIVFKNISDRMIRRKMLTQYYSPFYVMHDMMVRNNCYNHTIHKYMKREIISNGALGVYIWTSLRRGHLKKRVKALMIFFIPRFYVLISKTISNR